MILAGSSSRARRLAAGCRLAILLAAAAPPAAAQSQVRGRLVDAAGEPIGGGEVVVSRDGESLPAVRSDSRGEWSLGVRETGRWEIRASAQGYATSEGWVTARGAGPSLVIGLEPDLEAVARRWLTEGNRLLEGERPAEARARYESALTVLLGAQTAPVHRAVARARFLEGDQQGALESLERALLNDPADAEARELLLGVAELLEGRAGAEAWLARLDADGPAAAYAAGLEPVAEKPLDGAATGRFSSPLAHPSPLGAPELIEKRLGREYAEPEPAAERDGAESAELYVPEHCTEARRRCGLFVWVSPVESGRVPDPEMSAALDERGVIWAGANRSGNSHHLTRRIRLALEAAHAVTTAYPVDPERVWVGGYSGGGRIASRLALHYPELFRGGLFYMGVDFFDEIPIPYRPGTHWPPKFRKPERGALDSARARSRFAFVTGEYDFNRSQTRATLAAFESARLERATLIDIPQVGHYRGLKREIFERVLDALEPAAP